MNSSKKKTKKSSIFSLNPYNATGFSDNSITSPIEALISRITVNFDGFCQDKPNFATQTSLYPEKCRLKKSCQGCGGSQGNITPVDRSSGNPHSYRLDCRECGRFQRWVGQREFDRKLGKQGGRGNA